MLYFHWYLASRSLIVAFWVYMRSRVRKSVDADTDIPEHNKDTMFRVEMSKAPEGMFYFSLLPEGLEVMILLVGLLAGGLAIININRRADTYECYYA